MTLFFLCEKERAFYEGLEPGAASKTFESFCFSYSRLKGYYQLMDLSQWQGNDLNRKRNKWFIY
jgi:hypothetical protein